MKKVVPIVNTEKLAKVKEFYQRHFGFRVTFENESFLGLQAPDSEIEISFMRPDGDFAHVFGERGLTYCFEVEDVNVEHERLVGEGLTITRPLQDNPWGDRSFVVRDPVGVDVYVYKPIPPGPEFAQYMKE